MFLGLISAIGPGLLLCLGGLLLVAYVLIVWTTGNPEDQKRGFALRRYVTSAASWSWPVCW